MLSRVDAGQGGIPVVGLDGGHGAVDAPLAGP
jgi:hypothetical protein